MHLTILFVLIVFFYFDGRIFYKQNNDLFRRIFAVPNWFLVLFFGGLFLLIMATKKWEYLTSFFLLFGFPLYLIKRWRFRKTIKDSPKFSLHNYSQDLRLASDTFGILLVWLAVLLIIALIIKIVWHLFPAAESELGELVFVAVFSSICMVILIQRTVKRYDYISFNEALGLQKNKQPFFRLVILPLVLGLALAIVSSSIILSRSVQPTTPLSEVIGTASSFWVIYAFIAVAVLLAPFFEEIVFRGYFFYVLQRIKGQRFAVILIALTFGLMHCDQYWGDWLAIAVVTFLGFLLTFLRAWTGSSISSIVTHYTYNGAMTIIPVIILISTNPSYFEYQMNYVHLTSQEKEELLRKSIEAKPDHAISYNDLAWLYAQENKNLEQALALVETALSYAPEEYAFLDTKAEILYKMGRVYEAVELGEYLLQRFPDSENARMQLEKFKNALP